MKRRRGKNGLTKVEFLQRDIDEEVSKRVDEILDKIVKRKAGAEEEKCYPAPFGNISMCPHNEQGRCVRLNKKCDNRSTV